MKFQKFAIVVGFLSIFPLMAAGQINSSATPQSAQKLSDQLAKNLESFSSSSSISGDRRQEAYANLMEAQGYIWRSNPSRFRGASASNYVLARTALQKALELDPRLAEGYTALAEISLNTPPNDVDEAIALATIATKLEPNNFGGHRILARLNTYKSRLNHGTLDPVFADKAVAEWKEVARLDPRNAEAWAFLSEFYASANNQTEEIAALKKWLSASTPIDTVFYGRVMGGRADLSPESASLKLGPALIKAGRTQEAIEVLGLVVADEPENQDAVDLLKEALESADSKTASVAIESLQQAAYANPGNLALLNLLAQVQWRAGKTEDAIKGLADASEKLSKSDKAAASNLQIAIGDLYASSDNFMEAIRAYENALKVREIDKTLSAADQDRDFAIGVFERIIQIYKRANKPVEAKAVIDRARKPLGNEDLFADKQLISLYRETGRKADALAAVRVLRAKTPSDYSLLRLEASVLTENGKVDEAVALIKKFGESSAGGGGSSTVPTMPNVYDDFSNYLFISQLYNEANRGKDAIAAARAAFDIAQGSERKQIARLTMASAQQRSGDYAAAETTLRSILKETPRNPIAMNNLGYFLLERNERFDEALNLIEQAIKIDPTNPSYLDSLGWAYFKLGKYAEAEKFLRDAARVDTGSSTIYEHLGDVYEKQGKAELARSAWNKALQLASSPTELDRLKGKLELKARK